MPAALDLQCSGKSRHQWSVRRQSDRMVWGRVNVVHRSMGDKMNRIIILLMLSISSTSTLAQTPCVGVGPDPKALSTAIGRAEYAESLLYANEQLNRAIPELSPRQEDWLNRELSEGGRRLGNALWSAEYKIRVAKSHTALRSHLISQLSKGEIKPIAQEILYWSRLALSYFDSAFAPSVAHLVEEEIIDSRYLGGAPPGLEPVVALDFLCRFQGGQILEHIVIPYLDGTLSK